MNFFALQEEARRSSRRMVLLFALAVVVVVAAVDAIALLVGFGWQRASVPGAVVEPDYVQLGLISLAVLVVIALGSLYRTMQLRGGGSAVAKGMGATEVTPDTTNPAWRQLRNVIEEIAIASGVPVPEIYVMENEAAINAFAAGYSPADAAVCVTQGCLDRLSRDELQGVIAHEFSHVLNGDMRLNIRLIGLLFGILVIGLAGRMMLYSGGRVRGRNSSSGTSVAVIGLAILAVGYIGFFFGRLIQAAVARSRESLADASAVQFTRQSAGIAGALKKIAALPEAALLEAQDTQQVAHMLFGDGIASVRMFATHPPLFERIKTLDPGFDPAEIEAIARAWVQGDATAAAAQASAAAAAPAGGPLPGGMRMPGMDALPDVATAILAGGAAAGMAGAGDRRLVTADGVTAQVAAPGSDDFRRASGMREGIPAPLQSAARDPETAPWLLLAMAALRAGADLAGTQMTAARQLLDAEAGQHVERLAGLLRDLHPGLRMPLVALAFPTLRRLPRPRLERLLKLLDAIIRADGEVQLDEYCLARMVQVQVLDALDPAAAFAAGPRRLHGCRDEARDLFALVAHYGNDDEDTARRAFAAACAEAFPRQPMAWELPGNWQHALDHALTRLDRISPPGKELVVRGLVRAIRLDGRVTVAESELLRVVCAALHCPLPPMLQAAEA